MKKYSTVFMGTSTLSQFILEALWENSSFDTKAVITKPGKPQGRNKKIIASPIEKFCEEKEIPILISDSLEKHDFIEKIKKIDLDLILLASFSQIIPTEILNIPHKGAVCFHPSLLPLYRGTTPVPTAILNNESETGFTFFIMDEKIDHGPIIYQEKMPISSRDTSETLLQKLFSLGAERLSSVLIDYLSGEIKPRPQDHQRATFTKRLSRHDGYFNVDKENKETIWRKFKAYFPWPGIWTYWNEKRLKIIDLEFVENKLIINKVQLEGKKEMSLEEFKNGYPDFNLF